MFKLLRVRVENFRNYLTADLPFHDGITVISGLNGRGKSTLVEEAPEWALFSKVKKGTTQESIRCSHSSPESTVRVTLDFLLDNRHYTVERVLTSRNSTNATLYVEGRTEPLVSGTKGVNEYITRLFGFGHQVFTTSFIARQKELDALSDFTPETRMKFFAKFAGVESLDKAKPQVRKDVTQARTMADTLRGQLPTTDDAEEALRYELHRVKGIEHDLKETRAALLRAEKRLRTARESVTGMEKAQGEHLTLSGQSQANKRRLLQLEGDLMDLQAVVESLEGELAGYVPVKDIEGEIEALERDRESYRLETQYGDVLREAKLNSKALTQDISAKEKEAGLLEKKALALRAEPVSATAARLETARETEGVARGERVTVEARVRELTAFVASVDEGLLAQCPTCYTDFTGDAAEAKRHVRGELAKFKDALEAARTAESSTTLARQTLGKELEAARAGEQERELLVTKAAAASREAESLRPSLEREEGRKKEATEKLSHVELKGARYPSLHETETVLETLRQQRQHDALMRAKAAELVNRQTELARVGGQLADLEKEQKDLIRRIKVLKFDAGQFAVLRTEAEAAESERQGLTDQRAEQEKQVALAEHTATTLREDIARTEALREKIVLFTHNAEVGTVVDSVISLLRDDLAKRIAPRIAEHASRLLRDMTDGLYQNILLDDTYRVTVLKESGDEWPLAQFSGGEQDAVNLCLRLGISQVILEARNLPSSLLILDEVFGSQDEERQLAIVDALGRLRQYFPQILLITHITDVKEKADHIVLVERDNDGVSIARALV